MNAPLPICPCCGQPAGNADALHLADTLGLGGISHRLVSRLARDFGRWVPSERVINSVYADDIDGGPDNARRSLSVCKHRIQPTLREAGFGIEGKPWYGWRLVRFR